MKTLTKCVSAAAALAVGVGAASTAGGAGAATWTIQLRGTVPLICNAALNSQGNPNSGNGNQKKLHLGQLTELCNNGNGYTVYATTPAGVTGDFVVDSKTIPVQSSGVTAIDMSSTAAVEKREVFFEPQGGPIPATISLSVVAN
ncbi:MAG TPA: hypothetical protein VG407_18880 [Caulobacteraceae bacterium]|jgi:hypothetical protein|nr:hypothetical protein [Caulobacteraceae bacterium]